MYIGFFFSASSQYGSRHTLRGRYLVYLGNTYMFSDIYHQRLLDCSEAHLELDTPKLLVFSCLLFSKLSFHCCQNQSLKGKSRNL